MFSNHSAELRAMLTAQDTGRTKTDDGLRVTEEKQQHAQQHYTGNSEQQTTTTTRTATTTTTARTIDSRAPLRAVLVEPLDHLQMSIACRQIHGLRAELLALPGLQQVQLAILG